MSSSSHSSSGQHHGVGHVVPLWLLAGVLFILLLLTVVTVLASNPDFHLSQRVSVTIAMAIATVKATLVGLYFMHLRWDRPFNAIIFVASLALVALFIWFAMLDTFEYRPDIDAYREAGSAANNEYRWTPDKPTWRQYTLPKQP